MSTGDYPSERTVRKPVVVGIDGTELGRLAALWAGRYADAVDRPLLLVLAGDVATHVEHEQTPDPSGGIVLETVAWLRRQTIVCDIEATVRSQSPAALLEEMSARAALLVVGDSGEGALGAVVRGSVGHHVAGHAKCAVALVPPSWRDRDWSAHPKITVGVSSSEGGRRALEFAVSAAVALHGTVHAVRCWEERDATPGANRATEMYLQQRVVRSLVAVALRRCGLRPEQLEIVYDVRSGPVGEVLREAAGSSNLLVIGTRFRSGARLSRLGLTTSRLSRRLPCPAVIVGPAETVRMPGRGSLGVLAEL